MLAGKFHHLRRLCLSHFVRINPALGNSFTMNAKHEMPRTFAIHVEEPFNRAYDKFHWSVVVVQEQHTSCCAFGGTKVRHLFVSDGGSFPTKLDHRTLK
jgi:hypothetical protein